MFARPFDGWVQRVESMPFAEDRAWATELQADVWPLAHLDGALRLHEQLCRPAPTVAQWSTISERAKHGLHLRAIREAKLARLDTVALAGDADVAERGTANGHELATADEVFGQLVKTVFCSNCHTASSLTNVIVCKGCCSTAYCSTACMAAHATVHAAVCRAGDALTRELVREVVRSGNFPFTIVYLPAEGAPESLFALPVTTSFAIQRPHVPSALLGALSSEVADHVQTKRHMCALTVAARERDFAAGKRLVVGVAGAVTTPHPRSCGAPKGSERVPGSSLPSR